MYRYPKDFYRPPIHRPAYRRSPLWSVPGYAMDGYDQPDGRSPRPERTTPAANGPRPAQDEAILEQPAAPLEETPEQPELKEAPAQPQPATDEINWKAKALELQAEMDNFRKRQQRRADEAIAAEKERLLNRFLSVADNLGRALAHSDEPEATLYQGVELTHRELMRLLESEGVNRIESVGQPFDPNLHEALAIMPAEVEPNTIIEEVEAGYTLGDKLLRPARVIVAAE